MEQAKKKKDATVTRFSRGEILRVKLAKLIKEGEESNPYEFSAIRPDCKLVALVRRYFCPNGDFSSIYGIPSGKIAEKLRSTQDSVRLRWHHDILPQVVRRTGIRLSDEPVMNAYLILQLRRACKGKLIDIDGQRVFPAHDWQSIDWRSLMPMWPQSVSETRLRSLLRDQPKFGRTPLPEVVKAAVSMALRERDKGEILKSAKAHLEEVRRILNAIADRGDAFLQEDKQVKRESVAMDLDAY
jgi:hypothetical protein